MTAIDVFRTEAAAAETLRAIRRLMDRAFAGEFADEDWAHTLGGWHAVVVEHGAVVSHAAVVPRVLEVAGRAIPTGYVEGVATEPTRQRNGLGSLVMRAIDAVIRREFALGALSTGEHAFYARLGWERWRGPTFVRGANGVARTEEDDDGIMVLRFGPSTGLDLTASIACEARDGDVW